MIVHEMSVDQITVNKMYDSILNVCKLMTLNKMYDCT